jgi:hypothetical protein
LLFLIKGGMEMTRKFSRVMSVGLLLALLLNATGTWASQEEAARNLAEALMFYSAACAASGRDDKIAYRQMDLAQKRAKKAREGGTGEVRWMAEEVHKEATEGKEIFRKRLTD